MKVKRTKPRGNNLQALPPGYTPTEQDVICAKGKEAKNHPGNLVLRALIRQHLEDYKNCTTKTERASVVSQIMKRVKDSGGHFVRRRGGYSADIGSRNAREKIGAAFRDLLHDQYRSSAKAKASIRRQKEGGNIVEITTGASQSESSVSQEVNTPKTITSSVLVTDSENEGSRIPDNRPVARLNLASIERRVDDLLGGIPEELPKLPKVVSSPMPNEHSDFDPLPMKNSDHLDDESFDHMVGLAEFMGDMEFDDDTIAELASLPLNSFTH